MRVLIAGSRSLLAQSLRSREAPTWNFRTLGRGPEADIVFDACAPNLIDRELATSDCLVICAASFADQGIAGSRNNVQVNVLGALALLEQAIHAGIPHLVFVSSISAIEPRDSYGLSKAMAERLLSRHCAEGGVRLTIVRPSQIYDTEGLAARHQPFLYRLIDTISEGREAVLYGGRDVLRNYVHVDDVAETIFRSVQNGLEGIFNAVHHQSLKISDVAESIRKAFNSSSLIRFDPDKPDISELAVPHTDSLFEKLAILPREFSSGMEAIRIFRQMTDSRAES